jgi:large subunit ribosomal protein L6
MPVVLPKGTEVKFAANERVLSVKGPKGTLTQAVVPGIVFQIDPEQILVSIDKETRDLRAFHGLYRALVQNMVIGATSGFEKRLEMVGVGYRAAVQGNLLDLQIGFSHPTKLAIPAGMQVKVEKNTIIIITGIDKQAVGQFAAEVRAMRPPEPYQGKGIRYEGEYVRKKAGKAAKTAK